MTELRKLKHGGHTIPRTRTNPNDRYRIRKGLLVGNWIIEDTHTGLYLKPGYLTSQEAVERADELNKYGADA